MALATTVPRVLKPLVPSAEGIAAILMQVCAVLCSACSALSGLHELFTNTTPVTVKYQTLVLLHMTLS